MKTPLQRLGFCVVVVGLGLLAYGIFNLNPFESFEECLRYGGKRGGCVQARYGLWTVLAGIAVMFLLAPLGRWILHGTKRSKA
jgi:hypothetical protein